jgi:phosphoglycerate dehydrogenase-like enzyme
MKQLHIYLESSDVLFAFKERDFDMLRKTHRELELIFHNSERSLLDALPDIEYLDTWFFEFEWYEKAGKLKEIFTPAAGKEYVKTHPNVQVHFGTFHGALMAETTLGLILNFTLRLQEFRAQQESKVWQRLPLKSLCNQTALILGYGSIGRVCGRLLSQYGMQVTGMKRNPLQNQDGDVQLISITELDHHLPQADHIISFLPGDDSTEKFISTERLKLISPNAYLYNLGRGTAIDETALLAALQNGELAGAALDVTVIEPLPAESGLWSNPRVVLLPHTSAYFEEYRTAHVTEVTDLITAKKL